MADKKITALQIQNQPGSAIQHYQKLKDVELPGDDEGKISLMQETFNNLERTNILIYWFLGRVADQWCNPADTDNAPAVDTSIDQLAHRLGMGKSTIYNFYIFYSRYALERVEKMARYGVKWERLRYYCLNRNKDVGNQMMDYIESCIDENDVAPEADEIYDKFRELTAEPVSNTGDSSQSAGKSSKSPPAEDQDMEVLKAMGNNISKIAENMEKYINNTGDMTFQEFITTLYSYDLDDEKQQVRDELVTTFITQMFRAINVMCDLSVEASTYSLAHKEQVCQGGTEVLGRLSRQGITPVIDDDEGEVSFGLEEEEEEEGTPS